MLEPEILKEAKLQAARIHCSLGGVIEDALIDYLKLTDIKVRRQIEENRQNEEHTKRLEILRQQNEEKERQIQEELKQAQQKKAFDKEVHRLLKGSFNHREMLYPVRQVVLGQYVGISLLFAISALVSLVPLLVPPYLIGLLGLVPIVIGPILNESSWISITVLGGLYLFADGMTVMGYHQKLR